MKKYFLKGVDEPLEVGDVISFTLEKEQDGKTINRDVNVTFTEYIIPLLLAEDVLEERDIEDDNPSVEEEDKNPTIEDVIDAMIEAQEESEKTIEVLADEVKKLKKKVSAFEKGNIPDTGGEYVNLKDYIKRNKGIFKPWHNYKYVGPSETVSFFDVVY